MEIDERVFHSAIVAISMTGFVLMMRQKAFKSASGRLLRRQLPLGPAEQAEIERAVDAVCEELGVVWLADERRARVASFITRSWRRGRRQPLNLVNAGFDALE